MSSFRERCSYTLIDPGKTDRTIFEGESKLEGYFAKYIDRSPSVIKWLYQEAHQESVRDTFNNAPFIYVPDFYLEFVNGEKFMTAIESSNKLTDEGKIAQWKAAKKYFEGKGIIFGVFTELDATWMSWKIDSNNDGLTLLGVKEEAKEGEEIPTPPSAEQVVKDVEPPPKLSWWEKIIPLPKK